MAAAACLVGADDDHPAPLAQPDLYVGNFPHLTFDPTWFLESDLVTKLEAEAFKAAMILFAQSWRQMPAGSIPLDNDHLLAKWCCMKVKEFQAVKAEILSAGWVSCSDGRAYHPYVVDDAKRVDAIRKHEKTRKQRQRSGARTSCPTGQTGDATVTLPGQPNPSHGSHALERETETETEIKSQPVSKGVTEPAKEPFRIGDFVAPDDWLNLQFIAYPEANVRSVIAQRGKYVAGKHPEDRAEQLKHMEHFLRQANDQAKQNKTGAISTETVPTGKKPKPREMRIIDGVKNWWHSDGKDSGQWLPYLSALV